MWKDSEKTLCRILDRNRESPGPAALAIARRELEVVLFEAPVIVRSLPESHVLLGFVQEAVALLGHPIADDVASFLRLPLGVVEVILGSLGRCGGALIDAGGRWSVPDNAPQFASGSARGMVAQRVRKLLCYWPEREVVLPALPTISHHALVQMGVHRCQGEVADWYQKCALSSEQESESRTPPPAVRILRLADDVAGSDTPVTEGEPDTVFPKDVLVTRCRLDVLSVSWVPNRLGVWEVHSRCWSRPTTEKGRQRIAYSPGEPFTGLSIPEHLIEGEGSLDELRKLFGRSPDAWIDLLKDRSDAARLQRRLNDRDKALIQSIQPRDGANSERWEFIPTTISEYARLISAREDSREQAFPRLEAMSLG